MKRGVGRPRIAKGTKAKSGAQKGYIRVTVGPLGDGHQEYLHRVVTKAPPGMVVDHKNNIKSDDRLANLKVMTRGDNVGKANALRKRKRKRK